MERKMNYRQWRLYEAIKSHSENNEICNCDLLMQNPVVADQYSTGKFVNRDYKREIRKDVQEINKSSVVQKPIISCQDGYYIAHSNEEFQKWAEKRRRQLLGMLKEFNAKCRKNSLDGQGIIIFDEDSKARDVYKSRINDL